MVFSCIKVGGNDPNVIPISATTSGSVIHVKNNDGFERICDNPLFQAILLREHECVFCV